MRTSSSLFIVLCASSFITAQELKTDSPPPPFKVVVQTDAPVQVVSAQTKWALPNDRRGVEVYIVVENASQKPVRSYTTRRELSTDRWACLGPRQIPAKGLMPGQKVGTSTWQGTPSADSPPRVWVDFVEFTDGGRWGADECLTGDWIDGAYAGEREQRDQFLKMFREEGADALMAYIRKNYQKRVDETAWKTGMRPLVPIWPLTGHSAKWEEGFTSGARSLVERVIEAERKWGTDEIEHELSRPIGPSEKKFH